MMADDRLRRWRRDGTEMASPKKLNELMNRPPADVVGLDCASHGIRAVRMKKLASGNSVVAAELLPPVAVQSVMEVPEGGRAVELDVLALPPRVRGRYAALLSPGIHSVVKLLRLPERFDLDNREQLLLRLGFEKDGEYRVGTQVIQPATSRSEALVLAAALPEKIAGALLDLMPVAGLPAPRFIGLSELGVVNAFHHDPRFAGRLDAYGLVHFDHDFSLLALFHQNKLSQLRTFSFGMGSVFRRIMKTMNVSESDAAGMMNDGAFDLSHILDEGTQELRSQFVVCRDFMERSENCSLGELYVSGAPVLADMFLKETQSANTRKPWNAMEAYPDRVGGVVPEKLAAESWCLTAALGACVGVLGP